MERKLVMPYQGLQDIMQPKITPPVFVICGADGAPDEIRQRSTYQLSLSMMTFSHTTARLVLVEQFFRADCILRGHPYPR